MKTYTIRVECTSTYQKTVVAETWEQAMVLAQLTEFDEDDVLDRVWGDGFVVSEDEPST